jgi:hypothetical protein
MRGVIEYAPQLAEAPPELASWIVRNVPEEIAEARARDGPAAEGEEAEERSHFAGTRKRSR